MSKNFWLATGLLAGTTIGAGIFSLPYVFSQLGIGLGLVYLSVFALVYSAIHLMYGELVETREDRHQFFYFAKTFLTPFFARIASIVIFGELLFVLTVYLVLAPTFFNLAFGVGGTMALLLFWALGSLCMLVRLNWLGWAEIIGVVGIFGVTMTVIFAAGGAPLQTPIFNFQNFSFAILFLPFGPLLFSLAARPAITKVVEEHRAAKKAGTPFSLKKAIVWGTACSAAIYVLFVFGVLRLTPNVSPESLNSLTMLSHPLLVALGIMGLITLWTSYVMVGIDVKDILEEDVKISKVASIGITFAAPCALYFVGFKDFLSAVSFTGSVFLALEGIFVIMMWRKAFPQNKRKWIALPLYAVFFVAMGYEIVGFFVKF